jgi:hypothetical protein
VENQRLANENDVQGLCKAISEATCIGEIPLVPDGICFLPNQLERITRTDNPFVVKINNFVSEIRNTHPAANKIIMKLNNE